jgi:hypothetical protein
MKQVVDIHGFFGAQTLSNLASAQQNRGFQRIGPQLPTKLSTVAVDVLGLRKDAALQHRGGA